MTLFSKCVRSVCFLLLAGTVLSACVIRNTQFEDAQRSYAQRDYSRAFEQLWIPARQLDPRALYAMGYMYYYGIGTDKDQDLGRGLINRAAHMNYPPAIKAMELILAAKHKQYVPFQKYDSSALDEGILEINEPLIPRHRKGANA